MSLCKAANTHPWHIISVNSCNTSPCFEVNTECHASLCARLGGSISACMPNPPASLKATFWYSCTRSGDFVCPTVACPAGSQASIAGQVPAPRVLAGSSQVSAAGCTYGCLTASACEKLWAQCKSSTDNVCIFADKPSLKQRWYMMTFIKKGSSEPLANVHCDPPRRYKFGHQG
jgi:hypothetical protein